MEKKPYHPCEAESHVSKCNGNGNTQDHFTPRAVAKMLGWSRRQVNEPENLQWLSQPCHTSKDMSTPLRVDVLRQERKGVVFTFEQHRTIFQEKTPPIKDESISAE